MANERIKTVVRVREADNYGSTVYYPVCELAQIFADVAGTRTLTNRVLRVIEAGEIFTVEVEHPTRKAWKEWEPGDDPPDH